MISLVGPQRPNICRYCNSPTAEVQLTTLHKGERVVWWKELHECEGKRVSLSELVDEHEEGGIGA